MVTGSLLKVENLNLVSLQGAIVRDLSFEIKQGEIVALTGKSGSGKTSIAHAILDVLPPGIIRTSGRFTFSNDGTILEFPRDSQSWHTLRGSQIGFIQQDVFGAFDPVLKIGKQMLMLVEERSTHDYNVESDIKKILEEVGIADIERIWNSYPHQLSGGQLQRCLLAFSIALKPALLIADEPTSAIDRINQIELLDLFDLIRKKYRIAILCITHEPAVVSYLADREISLEVDSKKPTSPILDKTDESPPSKVVLQAKDLSYTHRYGGLQTKQGATIKNVSFTISEGKCIAIIGESGSGKSTLAQVLVGLFVPSHGKLLLDGKQIHFESSRDINCLRSKVQLVMQDGRGSLHPNKTIGELLHEVVAFRRPQHGQSETDIRSSLNEVGLRDEVLNMKARSLSGGECLRVSIARALLINPDILICDESTSSLDQYNRESIIDLLQSLIKEKGLSLIIISHDEHVTTRLADEIMVFSEGEIVESGTPDSLLYSENQVTRRLFLSQATLAKKRSL